MKCEESLNKIVYQVASSNQAALVALVITPKNFGFFFYA
jgi:hypothetical protein